MGRLSSQFEISDILLNIPHNRPQHYSSIVSCIHRLTSANASSGLSYSTCTKIRIISPTNDQCYTHHVACAFYRRIQLARHARVSVPLAHFLLATPVATLPRNLRVHSSSSVCRSFPIQLHIQSYASHTCPHTPGHRCRAQGVQQVQMRCAELVM